MKKLFQVIVRLLFSNFRNVQETVDRLMKLGIKGIVDFTHSHFMVQEGVEVQTVDVVVAIQELVIKMKSNDQE